MAKIVLEQLIDIAFAVEQGDPFDWDTFKQGKQQAMLMIGTSVLEQFDIEDMSDAQRLILLATVTKLITENMILHTKLLDAKRNEM